MSLKIIKQDITKMEVDVIVNAANTELRMGGGVCGAIFKAAGVSELRSACEKLAPIKTGEAVITPGFALPAKHIIHTAGPVYDTNNPEQSAADLKSSYQNSLKLAQQNNCQSIAFPLISSGIYGYPKSEALNIAIKTILEYLDENKLDVFLTVFDQELLTMAEKILAEIEQTIS